MRGLALGIMLLAALVASASSAAQDRPLAPEAVRVSDGVEAFDLRVDDLGEGAQTGPTLLICTAKGVRVPFPGRPFAPEVTRRGVTARYIGYPEPEPAVE